MYMNKAQRREPKKPGCCSSKCTARIMMFLGSLTLICGALFLALAFFLFVIKGALIPLIRNENYMNCIYLMAFCGALILATGIILCPASKQRCCLYFYIIMLGTVVMGECLMVFLSMDYSTTFDAEINESFVNDVKVERYIDENIKHAVDMVQSYGKCCGAMAFNDYPKPATSDDEEDGSFRNLYQKVPYIPDSCCKSYSTNCARSDHPNNIYYRGCLNYFKTQVRENIYFTSTAAVAFLIIQSLNLIACIVLSLQKKSSEAEYEFKEQDEDMALFD